MNVSLRPWNGSDFKSEYFIIRNWNQHAVTPYLAMSSFYKVLHITAGSGLLFVGLHQHVLSSGDAAFVHPEETVSWMMLSKKIEGHFCLVHPRFFARADHVLKAFQQFTHTHPSELIVPMNRLDSRKLEHSFEAIHNEAMNQFEDKQHAILIHLQMILLKIGRAQSGATLPE